MENTCIGLTEAQQQLATAKASQQQQQQHHQHHHQHLSNAADNELLVTAVNGAVDVTAPIVESAAFSGFEGPEKKLEIDFKRVGADGSVKFAAFPVPRSAANDGLRALARDKLDHLCSLVSCTILSKTSNEFFDSYVLSESSLFVYPQKLLMKTCGTTTLLRCLATALQYAAECGLEVEALFYSRQKFIFPDKQKFPHTSFDAEVAHLSEIFPSGMSYCLGDQSSDHWYLFCVDFSHGKSADDRKDRNIEVMMEKLDADIMQLFQQATYVDVPTAAKAFAAADPALLVRRALPQRALVDAGVVAAVARLAGSLSAVKQATVPATPPIELVVVAPPSPVPSPSPLAAAAAAADACASDSDSDVVSVALGVDASPAPNAAGGDVVVAAADAADAAAADDDEWRDGVPVDVAEAIERGDKVGAARLTIRRLLPLHELFPGVVVDDHVFDPCGYSVNGLCGPTYVTMHVTPELSHSFVSFETNCSLIDAETVMAFVTLRLRPGRAALSVLADGFALPALAIRRAAPLALRAYRQRSRTHYELYDDEGDVPYDVCYSTFSRVLPGELSKRASSVAKPCSL